MSFPNMTGGPQGGAWMGYPPHGHPTPPPQPSQTEDSGLQTRPMGLKVQYTFEKDQQNCLARWPHALSIQTIPIDERNTIGIIDLRTCLQALAQCSPEIIHQPDKDYAVYALDYSEDDMPLVGQGMLSWGLDQPTPNSEPKMVTGRVTKNMLAALRGGIPETLEVKLKLNAVPRMQRPQTSHNTEMRGYGSNAPTPTPTDPNSEWSSFIQSNPNLGRSANGPSAPSPGFPPPRYGSPFQARSPAPDARSDIYAPQPSAPTPPTTHVALAPAPAPVSLQPMPSYFPPVASSQGPNPDDASELPKPDETAKSVRPKKAKSKAPKRKKSSTGNPRGRPPGSGKNRTETGNTSAIEDATDAEEAPGEGPKRKRAKTTKADWPNKAPLNSTPGSLRVAASTSGALRTMRPTGAGGNGLGGSHLQEIPRAPTPVPGQVSRPQNRPAGLEQPRRSSITGFEAPRYQVLESGLPGPMLQDARSPSESVAQSPQAYTPEGESPGDIGSSPPVPRSSPPPSSPVLPPMPMPQPDSGFMSGGFDSMIDEDDLQLPTQNPFSKPKTTVAGRPKKAAKSKAAKLKAAQPKQPLPPPSQAPQRPASSLGLPQPPSSVSARAASQGLAEPAAQGPSGLVANASGPLKQKQMVIQQECHGPQELLPQQSFYTTPASGRAQSAKAQVKNSRETGTTKAAAHPLKRANTEPHLQRQELPALPAGLPPMHKSPTELQPVEPEYIGPEHIKPDHTEPEGVEPYFAEPEHIQLGFMETEHTKPGHKEPTFQPQESLYQSPMEVPIDPMLQQAVPQQAELAIQPTIESPYAPVEESQAPTPIAPETTQDLDENLLRLLSEPMDVLQDIDPELPQMTALHPNSELSRPRNSETVGPGSMPPIPASDPGALASAGSPFDTTLEEITEEVTEEEAAIRSKNNARKQSIKKRLEDAVQAGKMPTFCSNCGSISTPTWRKIWTQDSDGSPDIPEYSDKPGCITAIVILHRDENGKPTKYRTVKKYLGPAENPGDWTVAILCNPCGLWLSKYQTQRPQHKWETDFAKIGKPRRKRTEKTTRSKKGKGQDTGPGNLTSEAYFTTDPIGPDDQEPSPPADGDEVMLLRGPTTEPPSRERGVRSQTNGPADPFDEPGHQGSTQSRVSGTAQSPAVAEEDGMGQTRRLLFPSPKKDGQPKVLGEVAVNIVRTTIGAEAFVRHHGKENSIMNMEADIEMDLLSTPKISADQANDMAGLFGTPARPSTPEPNERPSAVFKTPTRPTPSHRPITRSVSKSIRTSKSGRTVRTVARTPGHALHQVQQTPTKTPRSSARLRAANTPKQQQHPHAHFAVDDVGGMPDGLPSYMTSDFGTPFSSTLHQLLSEANDFTAGSSAHGLADFDLPLGSDNGLAGHLEGLDFGHFLTTDAAMPSSPPIMGMNDGVQFDAAGIDFEEAWEAFGDVNMDAGLEEADNE